MREKKKSLHSMEMRLKMAGPARHGTLRRFVKGGMEEAPDKMAKIAARHIHPRRKRAGHA